MISDVLSEAVHEIKRYLAWKDDNGEPMTYHGELREHIIKLVDEMEWLREYLDNPFPPHADTDQLNRFLDGPGARRRNNS